MKEITKGDKIGRIITGLAEYYDRELSVQVIDLYVSALEKYDLAAIEKLAERFISSLKSMPKIADFNEVLEPPISLEVMAEFAWAPLVPLLDECLPYTSFTIKDKVSRKVLSVMGPDTIWNCKNSELHWKKAEFIKLYMTYSKLKPDSYEAPDYFPGSCEINNRGLSVPEEKVGRNYNGQSVYVVEAKTYVKHVKLKNLLDGGQDVKCIA